MRRPLFGRDSGLSTVNTAKCYAGCDSHRRPVRRTTPRRKCRCGASVSVPLAGASLGDAPPIGPIVRIPRQELIATHLRRRILRGEIAAGDTLPPEVELMAQFGVSRSTLRETFRILETESLISVWRGSRGGAQVTSPELSVAARAKDLWDATSLRWRRTCCGWPTSRTSRRWPAGCKSRLSSPMPDAFSAGKCRRR